MLIAFCSDKGSPGTTTTTLAVASAWSTPAVVVEADPFGGDLAIRMRTQSRAALPETPTVLTVATAARTGGGPFLVAKYAQHVNDQLTVIPGHLVAEQIAGISDWEPLATALAKAEAPVFVDLGRIHSGSPILPVAARADVVVVVARADPASVIRLRERVSRIVPTLAGLRGTPPQVVAVLVSSLRHGPDDATDLRRILADTPAGPHIADTGFVAFDPAAVGWLESGEAPTGRLARTSLARSTRTLVEQLKPLVPGPIRTETAASGASDG